MFQRLAAIAGGMALEGVATGFVKYLSGCNQGLLTPRWEFGAVSLEIGVCAKDRTPADNPRFANWTGVDLCVGCASAVLDALDGALIGVKRPRSAKRKR